MAIQTKTEGNTAIVSVGGRLDAVTSPEYQKTIEEVVASGATRVVVDFAGLTYMSSAGVGVVLVSANTLKAKNGEFRLANVPKNVVSVFKMCGIEALLKVHGSIDDALAAMA
jgi:anti-anti-sigma factor